MSKIERKVTKKCLESATFLCFFAIKCDNEYVICKFYEK